MSFTSFSICFVVSVSCFSKGCRSERLGARSSGRDGFSDNADRLDYLLLSYSTTRTHPNLAYISQIKANHQMQPRRALQNVDILRLYPSMSLKAAPRVCYVEDTVRDHGSIAATHAGRGQPLSSILKKHLTDLHKGGNIPRDAHDHLVSSRRRKDEPIPRFCRVYRWV